MARCTGSPTWPSPEVPNGRVGVYTVWGGDELIYVGMGGRAVDPSADTNGVADLAGDVVAVMEAAGFGRFSVFGYSFTGAFAPWLAHLTDRVDAVVSGGFPIAGDYSPQYADIQARTEADRTDPAAWSEVTSRFDSRAALGFYRELSQLPPDFLVDHLPCPLFAFWGEDDEEIAFGGGVQLLASGLDRRRLKHASFPGHDHNAMLDHINEALPSVLAWFDELHRVK